MFLPFSPLTNVFPHTLTIQYCDLRWEHILVLFDFTLLAVHSVECSVLYLWSNIFWLPHFGHAHAFLYIIIELGCSSFSCCIRRLSCFSAYDGRVGRQSRVRWAAAKHFAAWRQNWLFHKRDLRIFAQEHRFLPVTTQGISRLKRKMMIMTMMMMMMIMTMMMMMMMMMMTMMTMMMKRK